MIQKDKKNTWDLENNSKAFRSLNSLFEVGKHLSLSPFLSFHSRITCMVTQKQFYPEVRDTFITWDVLTMKA